jgi:hypothetical protein
MAKTKTAKWSTPTRRDYLVKLWTKYGNQCLLGHTACPILAHYVHYDSKLVLVPQAKSVPCVDAHGNPLKDTQGHQLYLTVYPLRKDYLKSKRMDRLYELKSEAIIKDWIADDRKQAQANWQTEHELRHRNDDRSYPLHGKFSGIAKDIYYDNQPQFYLEDMGISGLTFKPFAKLRLASSNVRLYVDIADVLKSMSKNRRRKAVRYGKLNRDLQDNLDDTCWQAVKDYLNH